MDLKKRLTDHLSTIAEAGLVVFIFALMFLTMAQSPTRFVIVVNFFVAILIFIYLSVRARIRLKKTIRHMTREIAAMPQDLSDRQYTDLSEDTRFFYEELAYVRQSFRKRDQARKELLEVVNSVAINMEFNSLLNDLMPKLNEITRSNCSAFYTVNPLTNKMVIKHSIGFSKNIYSEFDITLGEGFVGYAASDKNTTVYRDIPEDTVYYVRTFLGKIKPRNIMVVPIFAQEQLTGVMVCASIYEYTNEDREMVELIRYYLGVAVVNGLNFDKNKRLTNELTFQNKLIQNQHEDMKRQLDDRTRLLNHFVNYFEDDCIYATDNNGLIILWNNGAERLFGYSAQEVIGKNINPLLEERRWPSLANGREYVKKDAVHTECFWLDDGGRRLRYEMTMTGLFNEQNEPIAFLVMLRELPQK